MAAGDTNAAEEAGEWLCSGSEAFAFAGDRGRAFHGVGFTYECDAQLYLRRAPGVSISLAIPHIIVNC